MEKSRSVVVASSRLSKRNTPSPASAPSGEDGGAVGLEVPGRRHVDRRPEIVRPPSRKPPSAMFPTSVTALRPIDAPPGEVKERASTLPASKREDRLALQSAAEPHAHADRLPVGERLGEVLAAGDAGARDLHGEVRTCQVGERAGGLSGPRSANRLQAPSARTSTRIIPPIRWRRARLASGTAS